jgi:hypothetical protein
LRHPVRIAPRATRIGASQLDVSPRTSVTNKPPDPRSAAKPITGAVKQPQKAASNNDGLGNRYLQSVDPFDWLMSIRFQADVWGTVGQWAGSVLTSVSVFLAIWILHRDKWRADRSHVANLVVWAERPISLSKELPFVRTIQLFNGGSEPVPAASVAFLKSKSLLVGRYINAEAGNSSIIPKDALVELTLKSETDAFTDARTLPYVRDPYGRVWRKDVSTGRIRRVRRRVELAGVHLI